MHSSRTEGLRDEIIHVLRCQGYTVTDDTFYLADQNKEKVRNLHSRARAERINRYIDFMESCAPKAQELMLDSAEVEVDKITPRIVEVRAGSIHADLFRWWNLAWWSLPYERAYGRQMRFIVWDEYHNAPIGLIGLQSPILRWNVRDEYLRLPANKRDFWINQSMNAQRLGALPPYNKFLGGKLVASLMVSDDIRKRYRKKYENYETLMMNRVIPSDLLFITTTGAYGKSSVYNRLQFNGNRICEFIGHSRGSGSFHIPDTLYEGLMRYLSESGIKAGRYFGSGPSVKIRNIDRSMRLLGFKKGNNHGIRRAVYLFSFVRNLESVIRHEKKPAWEQRSVESLTQHWKDRWAKKRTGDYPEEKLRFKKDDFMRFTRKDWERCKQLITDKLS